MARAGKPVGGWRSGPLSGSPGPSILHDLYVVQQLPYGEIGRRYGVSATTVMRWIRAASISPRSKKEARSLAAKANMTDEWREKLSLNAEKARANITAESRSKQSATRKRLGLGGHNKGIPMGDAQREILIRQRSDPEYRRKMSERITGEKNYNWKGGQKPEHSARLDRAEWRRTRREVYERDNWTCQDCGCKCLNTADSKAHPKRKIQCHHVIRRRDGGLDVIENLVTLCMSCHHKRERAGDSALFA